MTLKDATSDSVTSHVKRLAFQGAPGSFSHLAGHLFCKNKVPELDELNDQKTKDIKYAPCQTYDEVVKALITKEADFGLLPLENSSVGATIRSFELITNNQVALLSDIYLPTRLQLIGLPNSDLENVKRVISHPLALKQCRGFLAGLENIDIRPYWDTAGACFFLKRTKDPSIAAVAGMAAAQASGLKILSKNIDDYDCNTTRYGVVSSIDLAMGAVKTKFPDNPKLSCSVELDRSEHDLTQFLETAVKPVGGEILNILSFPVPDKPWHYVYILEIKVKSSKETQGLWTKIRSKASRARILGIYGSIKPDPPRQKKN